MSTTNSEKDSLLGLLVLGKLHFQILIESHFQLGTSSMICKLTGEGVVDDAAVKKNH